MTCDSVAGPRVFVSMYGEMGTDNELMTELLLFEFVRFEAVLKVSSVPVNGGGRAVAGLDGRMIEMGSSSW